MKARTAPANSTAAAQARLRPSKVLVPLPLHPSNTRLRGVALCRILAVSLVISTIKVERPDARSSEEPIRVKMRSIRASLAPWRARSCRCGPVGR